MKYIKLRKINNSIYCLTEYGVEKNKIIWATVYQGSKSWYKTIGSREWKWVVKHVGNDEWEYEEFRYFKDARNKALEIARQKES